MKSIIPLLFLLGCQANKAPTGTIFEDPWLYHICYKCESKDGGCYLKRRTIGFRTEEGLNCYHDCERDTKGTFDYHITKKKVIYIFTCHEDLFIPKPNDEI